MKISLKQSSHTLPLIIMLTLFAGIGLIVWFGILPFQRFITEKADGIQEYHASRENRERQIARLPDLQNQFENILAHEKTLQILLSENQIVDFVKTLEQLATDTNTVVRIEAKDKDAIEEKKAPVRSVKKVTDTPDDTDISGKKKTPMTILESVPYDRYLHVMVIVTGEYQNIMAFLHKVETLPIGMDIIGLSIRKREEEASKPTDNPGRNPFLILGDGSTVSGEVAPVPEQIMLGSLEAEFDTVIYMSKGE